MKKLLLSLMLLSSISLIKSAPTTCRGTGYAPQGLNCCSGCKDPLLGICVGAWDCA